MSSARKRRYINRLTNQRTREQQLQMMLSWNANIDKIIAQIMIYPKYNPQLLLTHTKETNHVRKILASR